MTGAEARRFVRELFRLAERDEPAPPARPPCPFVFFVQPYPKGEQPPVATGTNAMVAFSIDWDARIRLAKPQDRAGVSTTYDGPVTWESLNPDIITVQAEGADGMSALVTSVGEGTATLRISADAQLGDGVDTLTVDYPVEILPGNAQSLVPEGVELIAKAEAPSA